MLDWQDDIDKSRKDLFKKDFIKINEKEFKATTKTNNFEVVFDKLIGKDPVSKLIFKKSFNEDFCKDLKVETEIHENNFGKLSGNYNVPIGSDQNLNLKLNLECAWNEKLHDLGLVAKYSPCNHTKILINLVHSGGLTNGINRVILNTTGKIDKINENLSGGFNMEYDSSEDCLKNIELAAKQTLKNGQILGTQNLNQNCKNNDISFGDKKLGQYTKLDNGLEIGNLFTIESGKSKHEFSFAKSVKKMLYFKCIETNLNLDHNLKGKLDSDGTLTLSTKKEIQDNLQFKLTSHINVNNICNTQKNIGVGLEYKL